MRRSRRLQACKFHNNTSQAKKTYATSTLWRPHCGLISLTAAGQPRQIAAELSGQQAPIALIRIANNIHRKISEDSTLKSHGLEARCSFHPRCLVLDGNIGGARLERLIPRLPHMIKSKLGYLCPIVRTSYIKDCGWLFSGSLQIDEISWKNWNKI